jgi:hypothetical protein
MRLEFIVTLYAFLLPRHHRASFRQPCLFDRVGLFLNLLRKVGTIILLLSVSPPVYNVGSPRLCRIVPKNRYANVRYVVGHEVIIRVSHLAGTVCGEVSPIADRTVL